MSSGTEQSWRIEEMNNKIEGIKQKYYVERCDGKPLKGDFAIVLEVGDPNSWPALRCWAETVRGDGYVQLAHDVEQLLDHVESD